LTSLDFVTFAAADERSKEFLGGDITADFSDQTLKSCVEFGIGILHDGLKDKEIIEVLSLYQQGHVKVLVVA
jgi:hypothetical protein